VTVRDFGEPDSLVIQIDAASNTYIGRWDGDPASVRHLTRDLIAAPYALLERPNVLVIGPGGGIDLLVARAAGAASVVGVEVNPAIVAAMEGPFAAFSGHAYTQPGVRIETDEARSFIRRSGARYDLIQAGYIDTYAATAGGAFALTENTLYTVDAYADHLDHLTPHGIVALQRYFEKPPQQSARLVVLALAALSRRGVAAPGRHVVVLRKGDRASVLVRLAPFEEEDVRRLEAWAAPSGIELVAAPGRAGHGVYAELLAAPDWRPVVRAQALDLSPVGDDRPFFFYVVRPEQFWKGLAAMTGERVHSRAVFLLVALLLGSLALCALLVVLPLLAPGGREAATRGATGAVSYFFALGLGFMLVEVGLLQRTMLYLGHPALSLSVVLSTLLVSAGLGARTTQGIALERSGRVLRLRLLWVLAAIVVVAFAWPPLFRALLGLPRAGRIALTIAVLAPVGFLLGQALPLGLRRLGTVRADLVPWAWSVNGGASVLGSVLAMAIAINNGYTATLLAGALAYAVAWALAPRTATATATSA
jgi:predicted membrane-bound spermidine synthase